MNKKIIPVFTVLASLFVGACSNTDLENQLPDNRPDYRKSKTVNTLEIPPDLTSSSVGNRMNVPAMDHDGELASGDRTTRETTAAEVFAKSSENIHGSGDARWIEVNEKPSVVWTDLRNFWLSNGLPLKRSDQEIGIMETDWLERALNAPRGSIQGLVDKIFGGITDSGERDKFRVRLDYFDDKTYIYLTHYSTTEEKLSQNDPVVSSGNSRTDDADYTWVEGERNPELEIEMLRRISIYLDQEARKDVVAKSEDEKPSTNKLELTTLSDKTPALFIRDNFNQSWILLGIAIDRAGYKVTGRDRKNGNYSIAKEVITKTGFIFKSEKKTATNYRLRMSDQGDDKQVVIVQAEEGEAPIRSEQARSILQKISTEIKF